MFGRASWFAPLCRSRFRDHSDGPTGTGPVCPVALVIDIPPGIAGLFDPLSCAHRERRPPVRSMSEATCCPCLRTGRLLCPRPWSCPRPAQREPTPPPGLPRRASRDLYRRVRKSGAAINFSDKADKSKVGDQLEQVPVFKTLAARVVVGVCVTIRPYQFLNRPYRVIALWHPEFANVLGDTMNVGYTSIVNPERTMGAIAFQVYGRRHKRTVVAR